MDQVDNSQADALRVGIVGLGMIGAGVAVSLTRRGRVPTVYDIRPDAADGLAGVPACVAQIGDVARACDVVLVAVLTADQARSVIAGREGLLESGRPGMVVVLLSTVDLDAVTELSALCEEKGVDFLDAGVSGGAQAAENGLTVMVGGRSDVAERVRPVLEDFARAVVYCGDLGAGMVTKLARNALTYSVWAAVREAASIATAGGVRLERLLEVLEHSEGGTHPLTLLRVHAAGVEMPQQRVDSADALAQKDLAAAQQFAGKAGIEVPIVDVVRARMRHVYSGQFDEPLPTDTWARGLEMMDRVYGPGFSNAIPAGLTVPTTDETVTHLFAEIWSRAYLTIRDRRLLVLGATAMLGRADLLEVQLRGALARAEFTVDQIRELVLHLHPYAGWGNGTIVQSVAEKLIAEITAGN